MEYPQIVVKEYHALVDVEAFDAVKRRLYTVSGCKNYEELAVFLDTKPSRISDARRRLRIPVTWLQTAFLRCYANPTWILEGEGEPHL